MCEMKQKYLARWNLRVDDHMCDLRCVIRAFMIVLLVNLLSKRDSSC